MLKMLKHTGLILPAHNNENRVMAIAWSSDGSTLAAALADNTIYTFHGGVMKHLIKLECPNSDVAKVNRSIKGIAFSPDSTKLAVAHARGAVQVHKIENDWVSDTTFCNEFLQNSAVTCLVWSTQGPIVFGLENGKVRASQIETEMNWTLYCTDSPTIAVAINDAGTSILSSHSDGSVFQCSFSRENNSINVANRILTRLSAPQVIVWARDKILIADRDRQVAFYDDRGKLLKTFDYSQENLDEKSNYAYCSVTKTNVAVALSGKVHLYTWSEKSEFWEEIDSSATNIIGTVTALALKKDGTKLAIGGIRGAVAEFKLTNAIGDKCPKTFGVLIRNVDSNLVSEISLENDNGLPGSKIWPTSIDNRKTNTSTESKKYFEKSFDDTLKLRKSVKIEKSSSKNPENSSFSLVVVEPKNKSEIVSSFSTWKTDKTKVTGKKSKQLIDYISSDIASSTDKSSFSIDFGSILSSDESAIEIDDSATIEKPKAKAYRPGSLTSAIPTTLTADGMLFQNLNNIPYDPEVDPPCWKNDLLGKSRMDTTRTFCRNCGRLGVSMKDCPRCKDAYRSWNRPNSTQTVISSPIRFTRQYTPEELRSDFTLQLALLASLSPGLQRLLEQQMFKNSVADEKI